MRLLAAALALAVLPAVTPAAARAQEPSPAEPESALVVDFNFLVGEKALDSGDWGRTLDRQLATGLESSWSRKGWPVRIAADVVFANVSRRRGPYGNEEVTRASTAEVAIGPRVIVPFRRFRAFAGAGPELAQGDLQVIRRGESDDSAGGGAFGWWAGGGAFWRLGRTANVGATVRWSRARVKAGGFEADAGGLTYAVTVGFGIPRYAAAAE